MGRGRKPKVQIFGPPPELTPPEWLGEVGREYFHKLCDRIAQVPGMLEQVDDQAIALICEAYEDFHRAAKELAEDGDTIEASNGFKQLHPALKQKNDALRRINDGLDRFGLNPRARKRMAANQPKVKDEDDGFAAFVG